MLARSLTRPPVDRRHLERRSECVQLCLTEARSDPSSTPRVGTLCTAGWLLSANACPNARGYFFFFFLSFGLLATSRQMRAGMSPYFAMFSLLASVRRRLSVPVKCLSNNNGTIACIRLRNGQLLSHSSKGGRHQMAFHCHSIHFIIHCNINKCQY